MNDDDLLEMLHSTHINQKTATNEGINFEEFYRIMRRRGDPLDDFDSDDE